MTRSARLTILFLFSLNILNYIDRQILYALLPLIKADLALTDTQLGALASAFMAVYMIAAPLIAVLSDRLGRVRWIAAGVFAWSLATLSTGWARTFGQLLAARALVGVGESSFGSISPGFVAELVPSAVKARTLAFFSMAIPVGSALGYVLGGLIGERWGWRAGFIGAGMIGLPLAAIALLLRDPRDTAAQGGPSVKPVLADYTALGRNRSFILNTLAGAGVTFCVGGLAVWMPTYYHRAWGLSVSQAGTLFGLITVATGIVGGLAGGLIADRLKERVKGSYFWVSAVGLLIGLPFALGALYVPSKVLSLLCLAAAETCIFLNTGPLTAAIAETTRTEARTMAYAANIFFIHLLGDAVSPTLIGWLSDRADLRVALSLSLVSLAAAAAFCLMARRSYDDDVRAALPTPAQ